MPKLSWQEPAPSRWEIEDMWVDVRIARRGLGVLAASVALAVAPEAGAVQISNLVVGLNPGNTADVFDDLGNEASQITSTVGVVGSTGSAFMTHYQAGVYVDVGGNPSNTTVITLNASYTISFDIIDSAGSLWQLDLFTQRVGARTSVTDGGGQSAFDLGAVIGGFSGLGTLASGSLGLAAIPRVQQTNSVNLTFDQNGSAVITGSGNGSVTLTFDFSATAESISNGGGNAGDEAAIRMGIAENLSFFTAGEYPGAGGRTEANDGHFVDVTITDLGLVPEPDTGLLLGLGLVGLAWTGRRRHTALR